MGSRYKDHVPFFDRLLDYDGGGYAPAAGRGCGCLLLLMGVAVMLTILAAPLWTAYAVGKGTWAARGLLLRLCTAVVTLVALSAAGVTTLMGFGHVAEVVLRRPGAMFPTGVGVSMLVSMGLLTLAGIAFIIGFLSRGRPVRRAGAQPEGDMRTISVTRPRVRTRPRLD